MSEPWIPPRLRPVITGVALIGALVLAAALTLAHAWETQPQASEQVDYFRRYGQQPVRFESCRIAVMPKFRDEGQSYDNGAWFVECAGAPPMILDQGATYGSSIGGR